MSAPDEEEDVEVIVIDDGLPRGIWLAAGLNTVGGLMIVAFQLFMWRVITAWSLFVVAVGVLLGGYAWYVERKTERQARERVERARKAREDGSSA